MSSRRLIVLAAACAAGVIAVPGTALAAGSTPHPSVKRLVQPTKLKGVDKAILSGFSKRATAARTAADSSLAFTATTTPSNGLYDVQLDVDVTGSTGTVSVTATWDGVADAPVTSAGDGTVSIGHTFSKLGDHTLTITVDDGAGVPVTQTGTVTPIGSDYTAYGPTRLLDTRSSKTTLKPHTAIKVKVGGNGGISADALAAVLNLTVTNPTVGGYITAYADGTSRPTSSNVNFAAKQTVPNLSIVPVGGDGYVDLYNGSSGTVDLIADINGYFSRTAAAGYTTVTPSRLVDTRKGTGATKAKIAANGSIAVQIAGKGGVPSGVTAVALNITATGGSNSGYLTAYPDGQAKPTASNVNYGANQNIANAVIVPVGSDGKIRLANGPGKPVDALVDVSGYYSASSKSAFLPVDPSRLVDTRSDGNGPIPAGGYEAFELGDGTSDQPTAFVLNATVPTATGSGYLSVAPDPNTVDDYNNGTYKTLTPPSVSTLNFNKGQTVPNLVQASDGSTGIVDFWNMAGTQNNLVLDMFGVYLNY